jgi:hypothetical protein
MQTKNEEDTPNKKKDLWDKADVILKLVASVITVLAAVIVAYYSSAISTAVEEKKLQAGYTELLSRREEADATLRKDMFKPIIDSFLDPKSKEAPLGRKILNLEMLTRNFHDSLNLKPLFMTLRDEIDEFPDPKRKEKYLARVDEVAMDISRKQMLFLEQHGRKTEEMINLEKLVDGPHEFEWTEALDGITRRFTILVLEADVKKKRLRVSLHVRDMDKDSPTRQQEAHQEFRVGFFDFPMIDNTRLSDNQRCAVVLSQFDWPFAEIQVVYFSGEYASVKDKAYLPEVLAKLSSGEHR